MDTAGNAVHREPWNKVNSFKELFNLRVESKLRGCSLVGLKIRGICHGEQACLHPP